MPAIRRRAHASWDGNLEEGSGSVRRGDAGLEEKLTWKARIGGGDGSSPEELIAAAHAGCFSMSLAAVLDGAGHAPGRVEVSAECRADHGPGEPLRICEVVLSVEAAVPGIDAEEFARLVDQAERACPVSQALRTQMDVTVRPHLLDA